MILSKQKTWIVCLSLSCIFVDAHRNVVYVKFHSLQTDKYIINVNY
jgi:hypothetical protein